MTVSRYRRCAPRNDGSGCHCERSAAGLVIASEARPVSSLRAKRGRYRHCERSAAGIVIASEARQSMTAGLPGLPRHCVPRNDGSGCHCERSAAGIVIASEARQSMTAGLPGLPRHCVPRNDGDWVVIAFWPVRPPLRARRLCRRRRQICCICQEWPPSGRKCGDCPPCILFVPENWRRPRNCRPGHRPR